MINYSGLEMVMIYFISQLSEKALKSLEKYQIVPEKESSSVEDIIVCNRIGQKSL